MEKYLTQFPYWDKLNDSEKNILRSSAVIHKYCKGEEIHSCNKKCLGMVYVISGKMRLYLLSEEGRSITLFYVGSGETCVLAASCIMSQITFHSELTAADDTELLIIPAKVFVNFINNNIYVRCYMYELSTKRFSEAMWVMQRTLFFGLDKRIAEYLISEYKKTGSTSLKLTQQQIAADIFSAREAVARMMKHFSDDGLITNQRGKVIINDIDALRNIIT